MDQDLKLDYYYDDEGQQFSFFKFPKYLIGDFYKGVSLSAKVLYGLMLDRMELSRDNDWRDEEGRIYIIYSVRSIMEDLNISKPTALKLLNELDCETGIGLIEKKRRGQGKPDIIYVKNFIPKSTSKFSGSETKALKTEKNETLDDDFSEVKKFDFKKSNNFTSRGKAEPEVKNLYLSKSSLFTSAGKITEPVEGKNIYPNKTNNKDIDLNDTNSINLSSTISSKDDGLTDDEKNSKSTIIGENSFSYKTLFEDNLLKESICSLTQYTDINENDKDTESMKRMFIEVLFDLLSATKGNDVMIAGNHITYSAAYDKVYEHLEIKDGNVRIEEKVFLKALRNFTEAAKASKIKNTFKYFEACVWSALTETDVSDVADKIYERGKSEAEKSSENHSGRRRSKNQFLDFQQHDYDMKELEKKAKFKSI